MHSDSSREVMVVWCKEEVTNTTNNLVPDRFCTAIAQLMKPKRDLSLCYWCMSLSYFFILESIQIFLV